MSQTAIYSEISSETLHQQELRVPLQAIWLFNVAYSLILLLRYENDMKGMLNGNHNLKWYLLIERYVETKGVIRSRKSKNRLYNGEKKKGQTVVYIILRKQIKLRKMNPTIIFRISKFCSSSLKWRLKCAEESARAWRPYNFTECRDKLFSLDD
jgi:hypothetical protein